MDIAHPFTLVGMVLILLGIAFILIPIVGRCFDPSGIPPWILYVYRSDGFVFVTSPLLIAISIIALLIYLLTR
ncbi:MAG: hypothetical protein QXG10_04800 [Candidatus Hadarchaeales archaeon]